MPLSTLLLTLEEPDRRGTPAEVVDRVRPCSPNAALSGFIGIIAMDGGILGIQTTTSHYHGAGTLMP